MRQSARSVVIVLMVAAILGCVSLALRARAQTAQVGLATVSSEMRVRPVPEIDRTRFASDWYEIARYPNFLERNCAHGVVMNYTPQSAGEMRIVNRCVKSNGGRNVTEGMARIADQSEPNTARYKVRFTPRWLAWAPWVWGDFWVIVLDPDYRYAAIGDPGRKYLWILSRTPTLDADTYHQIVAQLRGQGFDIDKLERTPQP